MIQTDGEKPWVMSIRIPRVLEPRIRHQAKRLAQHPVTLMRALIVEGIERLEKEEREVGR